MSRFTTHPRQWGHDRPSPQGLRPRCPAGRAAARLCRPYGAGLRQAARRPPAEVVLNEVQQRTAEQLFRTLGELKGGAMKFGQALSVLEAALPEELVAPYREQAGPSCRTTLPRCRPRPCATSSRHDLGPDWRAARLARRRPDRRGAHRPGAQGALARRSRRGREGAVSRRRRGADERPAPARPGRARRSPRSSPASTSSRSSPSCRHAPPTSSTTCSRPTRSAAFAAAFRDDPDFVVPDVVHAGAKVLVTEWLESPCSLAHDHPRGHAARSATTTASCSPGSSSPGRPAPACCTPTRTPGTSGRSPREVAGSSACSTSAPSRGSRTASCPPRWAR